MSRPAALVPLERLGALDGLAEVLHAPALAVSLGEARPTHALVLADPLPPAFAAAVLLAGGHLVWTKESWTKEPGSFVPDGTKLPGSFVLHGEPLAVRGAPRPLERFLEIRWTPASEPAVSAAPPELRVALRPSDEPRPVAALVALEADVEASLAAHPEERFDGVRFATDGREWILHGGRLDGLAGAAFHALPLEGGRTLLLPAGRALAPAFARRWLAERLGPRGDLVFWRDDRLLAVDAASLVPLTRRAWRRAHGR